MSPEGTGVAPEKPLQRCLKSNDFELAYLFLTSGADPRSVSIMEGDTPLHAALCIYFDKNGEHSASVNFLTGRPNLQVSFRRAYCMAFPHVFSCHNCPPSPDHYKVNSVTQNPLERERGISLVWEKSVRFEDLYEV